MKKYILCVVCCLLCSGVFAQKKDTIYLTIYNTGGMYMLKRAPYGEQLPKTDSIKEMVAAIDSFTTKDTKVPQGFVPKTNAEMEKLAPSNKTKPDAPVKATDADIAKVKNNAAKRTCFISQKDLKGKIVLIDYDKGCDQTDKCLQAQKAGAVGIVVIYDAGKKDGDELQSEEFDNDLKIPIFAVTSRQGDSIRMHLPSLVALYIKKPKIPAPTKSMAIDTIAHKTLSDNGQQTTDNVKKATDNGQQTTETNALSVATDSASFNKKFNVSPNPANNFIVVSYNLEQPQTMRVTVINAAGASVYTNLIVGTSSSGTAGIETKNWESGVYMVAIDKEGALQHLQKIVVTH